MKSAYLYLTHHNRPVRLLHYFHRRSCLMRRFLLMCSILIVSCISLVAATKAQVGPCPVFPADNYWNKDVSAEPVHPQSASIIANINSHGATKVHPDFGGEVEEYYGIPWITVDNT